MEQGPSWDPNSSSASQLLILQSSPLPSYLVHLRPKYSLQHTTLEPPQPTVLPRFERSNFTPIQNERQNYHSIYPNRADAGDHKAQSVGLRPLACWDCGLELRQRHGFLSIVSVVCCQVEVSVSGWSLVQRSPTERDVCVSVIVKTRKGRSLPGIESKDTEKKYVDNYFFV